MTDTVDTLKKQVSGKVILPRDPSYEESRQTLFNHAGQPAVIVKCAKVEDVVAAVNYARENKLVLSVRSGGHSGAGLSTNVGGVVIDLSPLHKVEVVDSKKHIVRVEAGAHWGDVAKALAPYKLAISSGDTNSVGVGGLTLGGGMGWMVRLHGLSIDNLQTVTLVTADGNIIRTSQHERPELFWAVRGGGGNFGVAVAFEFKAYPCSGIVGGTIIYEADDRKAVLAKWATCMRTAPEELSSTVVLFPGFGPGAKPQVMVIVCYGSDDEAAAHAALQPLMELAPLVSHDVKKKPYSDMLEDVTPPAGIKVRVRNGFFQKLDTEVIDILTDNFGKPDTAPIQIRSLGGAMNRIAKDATAFAHRESEALIIAPAFGPETLSEKEINALADAMWKPLLPLAEGLYVNFLTDVSRISIQAAYPIATMRRLAEVKRDYDPNNIFSQNANILPAA